MTRYVCPRCGVHIKHELTGRLAQVYTCLLKARTQVSSQYVTKKVWGFAAPTMTSCKYLRILRCLRLVSVTGSRVRGFRYVAREGVAFDIGLRPEPKTETPPVNPRAKKPARYLLYDEVATIKGILEYPRVNGRSIARYFGVSYGAIQGIKEGYNHISIEPAAVAPEFAAQFQFKYIGIKIFSTGNTDYVYG